MRILLSGLTCIQGVSLYLCVLGEHRGSQFQFIAFQLLWSYILTVKFQIKMLLKPNFRTKISKRMFRNVIYLIIHSVICEKTFSITYHLSFDRLEIFPIYKEMITLDFRELIIKK